MNARKDENSLLLPGFSVAICLLAPVAILAFTLPGGYLPLSGEGEGIFAVFLLSPYLLLGLFAWWQRHNSRRDRVALFVLTVLVVAFGVWALASEAAGFRAALAESPRGPEYMRHRYQRMELFIVPVLQWIACLVIGLVLFLDWCWKRVTTCADDGEKHEPIQ